MYCKKCGGIIDDKTNMCENCGKKYFSLKSLKRYISWPVILCLVVMVIMGGIIYGLNNDLRASQSKALKQQIEVTELSTKVDEFQDTILDQESEIAMLKLELRSTNSTVQEYREKAEFLDNRIAMVTLTGQKYHTYDCHYFQNSDGFYAYNVEAAKAKGYTPCSVCH